MRTSSRSMPHSALATVASPRCSFSRTRTSRTRTSWKWQAVHMRPLFLDSCMLMLVLCGSAGQQHAHVRHGAGTLRGRREGAASRGSLDCSSPDACIIARIAGSAHRQRPRGSEGARHGALARGVLELLCVQVPGQPARSALHVTRRRHAETVRSARRDPLRCVPSPAPD